MRHNHLPNIQVRLAVDGTWLTEYGTSRYKHTSQNVVTSCCTSYVQAHPGEQFAIQIGFYDYDHDFQEDVVFNLWIDGRHVTMISHPKEDDHRDFKIEKIQTMTDGVQNSYRRMTFSELEILDGIRHSAMGETINGMGTIRITLHDAKYIGNERPGPADFFQIDGGNVQQAPVYESDLKGTAVDLGVQLSDLETKDCSGMKVYEVSEGPPVADYTFKYRSREGLRALGFVE